MKDVNDMFGNFKKGVLKDVFETLEGNPKSKPKNEELKWPSIRIRR